MNVKSNNELVKFKPQFQLVILANERPEFYLNDSVFKIKSATIIYPVYPKPTQ